VCGEYLCGVITNDEECSSTNPYYPGIYTKIGAFTDWINDPLSHSAAEKSSAKPILAIAFALLAKWIF
jgi:hypothetical protein